MPQGLPWGKGFQNVVVQGVAFWPWASASVLLHGVICPINTSHLYKEKEKGICNFKYLPCLKSLFFKKKKKRKKRNVKTILTRFDLILHWLKGSWGLHPQHIWGLCPSVGQLEHLASHLNVLKHWWQLLPVEKESSWLLWKTSLTRLIIKLWLIFSLWMPNSHCQIIRSHQLCRGLIDSWQMRLAWHLH